MNDNNKANDTGRPLQEGIPPRDAGKPALKRAFERAADYHPNFFPAEIGLDPQKYHQGKAADYAGVKFFAEQGWIHGVHAHTPSPVNKAAQQLHCSTGFTGQMVIIF